MSRIPEDPKPPRKPRPKPKPERPEDELGPSTFRPAEASARPKAQRSRPAPADREATVESGGPTWVERILFGRVGSGHLARFCRQFAAYQESGVDLIRSLNGLEKQFSGTALGPVIKRLTTAVRQGESMTEAFSREPAFDSLFRSMLRAAEARGAVPETLKSMAVHYESRQRMIRQARSAMIYPVVVIVIAGAVITLLTMFVLPVLASILEDFARSKNAALPAPTQWLINFSHFVGRMGWWLIPLLLFGSVFGILWLYKRPRGKAVLDEVLFWIPGIGQLLRKLDIARFARTLASLTEAGVDIGGSLELAADVMQLTPYRRIVRRASEAVMEGTELSDTLAASRRFPHDVIAIVESGEETGRLPETLSKLADDYEEQVEVMVKNLGNLIQPLIMLVLGGIVFFIAIAFIMAYVSLIGSLLS